MIYNEEEILNLIANGENSSVEFKTSDVNADALTKEIVAFANLQGGTILLGIEDSGKISGLQKDKNIEEWISNISRNNVIPPILIEYFEATIKNKIIGIINVPKGKDKPYQTNKNKFLIRVGSTNRVATQSELMRLFQQRGIFHYDGVGVDKTSIKDLNLTKIDQYFNRYDIDFTNETEQDKIKLLVNTDILTEEFKATIAGLLIFGINPQKYLYNAGISFAHYNGNEITEELIDKQNIESTIDYQVDTTLVVIKNNLLNSSIIVKNKRKDKNFIYKDMVFKELLVNACVHRNYSITGSKIRVFLFNDHIEFISPGRLPNTITIEKLKAGVSFSVNPIIVKFMENLRYIDKLGRGIPMVCREVEKNKKKIIFKELGEEFRVILYF